MQDSWNNLRNYDEAIICFDKTIEINKKSMEPVHVVAGPNLDPSPFANKALTLLGQRKYEEAVKWFDEALDLKSDCVIALNGKGRALSNLGKYEEAVKYYDESLGIIENENRSNAG